MWQTGQIKAAVLLLLCHITITKTAKNNARPVHEVINEQARIDEKRVPYGNPLAGNSLQNAKLHAQHQQAMFHAERVRQQRAQLQKWNKAPQQMDSYMKAYHESQESHQLALEQMQAKVQEKKLKTRPVRIQLKERPQLEPVKVTRGEAIEKNRNHRSFGSVYYNGKNKNRINTSPGPTYDQGVTIKPNGNIGLNNLEKDEVTLYTEAIPSKTQYIYPKQYSQMHTYQSADDINMLNSLLAKPPHQQLNELNTLIHPKEHIKENLQTPIELYFYLNNPNLANHKYIESTYAKPYSQQYLEYSDHKPITEDVDDVDIKDEQKPFSLQLLPTPATEPPQEDEATTTTSNYYKIEVEQTISGKLKNVEYEELPNNDALVYQKPLTYLTPEPTTEGFNYLHSQHTGVQHLAQDGTGVSAYGDDDIHYAANYEFGYRVRDHETGNDFGHQEAKSGEQTQGQYHVLLPDGRMQQVRYSAGPEGFHADISYDHLPAHI